MAQIIYKNPVFFTDNQVKFYQLKIQDDEDVQNMFLSHEHFGLNNIELYILQQRNQLSQIVDPSQVFCETEDEEQVEVDVVDEEEEENEILVDQIVNDDIVDHEKEPLLSGHVYCPP